MLILNLVARGIQGPCRTRAVLLYSGEQQRSETPGTYRDKSRQIQHQRPGAQDKRGQALDQSQSCVSTECRFLGGPPLKRLAVEPVPPKVSIEPVGQ